GDVWLEGAPLKATSRVNPGPHDERSRTRPQPSSCSGCALSLRLRAQTLSRTGRGFGIDEPCGVWSDPAFTPPVRSLSTTTNRMRDVVILRRGPDVSPVDAGD